MEQKNIMKFMDEDGNEIELEVVERINIEKKEYLLLAPLDEDSDDVFAFRIDTKDGREEYCKGRCCRCGNRGGLRMHMISYSSRSVT